MHWIALPHAADDAPQPGVPPEACAWWALRFSPRVALIDEALLIEVSTTTRLWGGPQALLDQLHRHAGDTNLLAQAPTALQALAQLRMLQAGRSLPRCLPHDLPLTTLTDVRPHARSLEHMGCRTWGALRALPRPGVARRFGSALLRTLDQAWGDVPHQPRWVKLPEAFALEAELPALVDSAGALVWSASRLLQALQGWLKGRHLGALVLRLEWHYHLRRLDGIQLPPWGGMDLRTAEPAQEMAHLQRLLKERLAHCTLAAPVDRIALRVVQTGPVQAGSASLLPPGPEEAKGDPWHELQERWAARLGADRVQAVHLHADHRPERMQCWHPMAVDAAPHPSSAAMPAQTRATDARAVLWPAWLSQPPQPLRVQQHRPCLQGPLNLMVGPQRFEAGWWERASPAGAHARGECATGLARREYFVAHNAAVGWVWIFKDLLQAQEQSAWFLHGFYG